MIIHVLLLKLTQEKNVRVENYVIQCVSEFDTYWYIPISVVLVWLHIIRFSFSKKAVKERKFSFSFS